MDSPEGKINQRPVSQSLAALISLVDEEKVHFMFDDESVIGRSENAFIMLKDPSISRKHCVIKKISSSCFTICDMSTRGTFVNGVRLEKNKPHTLFHNDRISICNWETYNYKFCINKKFGKADVDQSLCTHLKEKMLDLNLTHNDEMKKLDQEIHKVETRKSYIIDELNNKLEQQEKKFKKDQLDLSNLLTSTTEKKDEAEKKLREMLMESHEERMKMKLELQTKISEIMKKEEELQQTKDEMELRHKKERDELEERCKAEISELKDKLLKSEHEQGRLQGLEHKLEETKKILGECELEQQRLFEEKVETESKLELKIVNLTKETKSKDKILKELEMKVKEREERENKVLKEMEIKLKEKEEREQEIQMQIEGLEDDMQCSICAEIYIEPTALICGHMFCKMCIEEWKAKKKICPMCRTKITATVRIFNMDSIIEKNISILSSEAKERRAALIKERQTAKPVIPLKKRKSGHRGMWAPTTHTNIPNLASATRPEPSTVISHGPRPVVPGPVSNSAPSTSTATVPDSQPGDLFPFTWRTPPRQSRRQNTNQRMESPVTVAAIDLTNISIVQPSITSSGPIDLTNSTTPRSSASDHIHTVTSAGSTATVDLTITP